MNTSRDNLDAFPVKDGFRLRGTDMTRIETFTDAAFAFALTLLVVSMDVPASYGDLMTALQGVPAFAASGVLLMLFWYAHHIWSRRYGLDDFATIILSVALVFTVLVYVYPLKFIATGFVIWIRHLSGLPVTSGGERITPQKLYNLFALYGAGFVAMCLTIVLLYRHAWRQRVSLGLNEMERFHTLASLWAWVIIMCSGLASTAIALFTPASMIAWPGWAYCSLPVVMPIYGVLSEKKRPASGTPSG